MFGPGFNFRRSASMGGSGLALALLSVGLYSSLYNGMISNNTYAMLLMCQSIVDGGFRAVKYSRISGMLPNIYKEGTHFRIPFFERVMLYDVRAKPRNISSLTGSKGKFCLFP